jgi:hypothetical protein
MEQHFSFFKEKPKYFHQLAQAKVYIDKKDYVSGINASTKLLESINKDYFYSYEKSRPKIENVLSFFHELRFYECFEFLIHDPDSFLKNKHVYVEQLQGDYYKVINKGTFSYLYHSKNSIILKMSIIDLLFNDNFYQFILLDNQKNFCDLYDEFVFDEFVKGNQSVCQALTIFGLALISAYQGNLSLACNGFNQAVKIYSPLNKLVKAIEYSLPPLNNMTSKEDFLLSNPLSKFKIHQEKASIANLRIR